MVFEFGYDIQYVSFRTSKKIFQNGQPMVYQWCLTSNGEAFCLHFSSGGHCRKVEDPRRRPAGGPYGERLQRDIGAETLWHLGFFVCFF